MCVRVGWGVCVGGGGGGDLVGVCLGMGWVKGAGGGGSVLSWGLECL